MSNQPECNLGGLPAELAAWLDQQTITAENIGAIRRQCLMPWSCSWNTLVRDETAAREQSEPYSPKPLLYGWEIMRTFPDPKDDKRRVRCSMIIAAPSIEDVWDYLATDRRDEAVEIETIHRFGPILEVLGSKPPPSTG